MPQKIFTSREVALPHHEMVKLRTAGVLKLGINDEVASQLMTGGIKPTKTAAHTAFSLWNMAAFAALICSIYFSFTSHWWWFIPGIIAFLGIGRANQKGNAQNVLDAAMVDGVFYEQVRSLGGWKYQMEQEVAQTYRR